MKKILDEEELYNDIEENGFSRGGHPVFQELLAVAKWMLLQEKIGKIGLRKSLNEYCNETIDDFNEVSYADTIKNVVNAALRNPEFRKPDYPIHIYSDELDKIKQVKDLSTQMVLLSCVVYARISGNGMIFSDNDKDLREIIRLSKELRRDISLTRFIQEVTPLARHIGLFRHINGKHHFYSLIDEPVGDISIRIRTLEELENLPIIYREYNGGYPAWCKVCGNEYIRDSRQDGNKICGNCKQT